MRNSGRTNKPNLAPQLKYRWLLIEPSLRPTDYCYCYCSYCCYCYCCYYCCCCCCCCGEEGEKCRVLETTRILRWIMDGDECQCAITITLTITTATTNTPTPQHLHQSHHTTNPTNPHHPPQSILMAKKSVERKEKRKICNHPPPAK